MGQGRNPLRAAALLCAALGMIGGCKLWATWREERLGLQRRDCRQQHQRRRVGQLGQRERDPRVRQRLGGQREQRHQAEATAAAAPRARISTQGCSRIAKGRARPSRWATDWSTRTSTTCLGNLAQRTFRFGLCTCEGLAISHPITTDSYLLLPDGGALQGRKNGSVARTMA